MWFNVLQICMHIQKESCFDLVLKGSVSFLCFLRHQSELPSVYEQPGRAQPMVSTKKGQSFETLQHYPSKQASDIPFVISEFCTINDLRLIIWRVVKKINVLFQWTWTCIAHAVLGHALDWYFSNVKDKRLYKWTNYTYIEWNVVFVGIYAV